MAFEEEDDGIWCGIGDDSTEGEINKQKSTPLHDTTYNAKAAIKA